MKTTNNPDHPGPGFRRLGSLTVGPSWIIRPLVWINAPFWWLDPRIRTVFGWLGILLTLVAIVLAVAELMV